MDLYPWIVIAHVFFVIIAFGAHGVSAFASFRVKASSDRAELKTLLDLSQTSLVAAGVALLVAILLGIWAAIMGGHFSRTWPWAAIVVLVVVVITMTPLAAEPDARAPGRPGDRHGQVGGVAGPRLRRCHRRRECQAAARVDDGGRHRRARGARLADGAEAVLNCRTRR